MFPSWSNGSNWAGLDVAWYEKYQAQFTSAWALRWSALDDCPASSSLESGAIDPPHAVCTAELVNVVVTPEA